MLDGLCNEIGVETFYPPDDKPVTRDFYLIAKKVCNKCIVQEECKIEGKDEIHGVWGGLSPKERKQKRNLKAKRKIKIIKKRSN